MEDQGLFVDTVPESAEAVIIGKGALPRELVRNFENRHLRSMLIGTQQELDPSLAPEFVFWFPASSEEKLSAFLTNFLISLKPKLVIVGYDDMEIAGMVGAAVENDLDARGITICDLYGSDVAESRLSILWSKLADRELVLPDRDQDSVLPIFIEDAAEAICLTALSSQTYGQVLTIAGSEEMTVLNVAYRIRDLLIQATGATPTFRHQDVAGPSLLSQHDRRVRRDQAYQALSWRPSTDFSEGFRRIVSSAPSGVQSREHSQKEELVKKKINLLNPGDQLPELPAPATAPAREQPPEEQEHPGLDSKTPLLTPRFHRRRSPLKRVLIGAVAVAAVGFTFVSGGSWAAGAIIERLAPRALDRLSSSARAQFVDAASLDYQQLLRLSEIYDDIRSFQSFLWSLIGLDHEPNQGIETFSRLMARGKTELARARVLDSFTAFAGAVSGDVVEYPSMTMSLLESQLTALLTAIGSLSQFPEEWSASAPMRQEASLSRELLPIVKWVLGFEEKRTMLLLVQNASELRPTGGFLTGIGFLTFEKGRLLDVTLMDIDSVDAQLTGAEKPPEPIRRLMGEDQWRVRDANWNPDGPQAADHIEQVVARATGRSVDGTIFLTSAGIRRILREVGSVFSSQGDEFSAENIIERVTFDGGASLGTGGTTEPLLDAVRGLRGSFTKESAVRFARGVLDAARHQEFFMTAHQPDIAQILSLVGFDGAIGQPNCPLQFRSVECTTDFLGVFDANLSVNRADYFLERDRDVRVTLAPQGASTVTVTLRYRNAATSTARPAGAYHGYTRIMVPLDSMITALTEEKDGRSLEVLADHDVQYGKRVEGFYLHVPIGDETTIRMSYTRGAPFELDNGIGGYNLLLQKQPGVAVAPTSVTIDHGASLEPVAISPDAVSQDYTLLFNLLGDRTTNVAVEFASVL